MALTVILITASLTAAAPAPTDARLADLGVEMVLDTTGRTGACDQLRFTSDGTRLLAVGDDKVVRVWNCDANGLTPAKNPTLRWSIFREQRGGIYALDIKADSKRPDNFQVGIGGFGLRAASAAVLDGDGTIRAGLTRQLLEQAGAQANTVQAIWSLAFAPDGSSLALGGSDGSVWIWEIAAKRLRRLGAHPGLEGVGFNAVRLVAFTSANEVVSIAADGWVLQWNLERDSSRKLFQFSDAKNLQCAVLDATKSWLAAGGQTRVAGESAAFVELRSLDGSKKKKLQLPERAFPKSLAFDGASARLAVGTYSTASEGFYLLVGGGTFLFDLTQDQPKAERGPSPGYYVDALAFHPDGKRLAVAGGDDHDVTLWDLRQIKEPTSRIVGQGRCIWGVGISNDFRYLGYRDEREPAPTHPNRLATGKWRVFDIKERRWADEAASAAFRPLLPRDELDGWKVQPDKLDGAIWYVAKGTQRFALPLAPQDKLPRCWTFLPADDEHGTLLVVGHLWGMSVFALGDKPPKLMRKFAGHQGEVVAIAPSEDGKFLVTASRDQTIAFWSLLPQANQGELGASFFEKGDRLIVEAVAAGSPAWEAHLQRGDIVTAFASGGKWIKGGASAWLSIVQAPPPGLECAFYFERAGKPFATLTTVRQRPLARFFPMRDREWLLWRYYDYFYDTSTHGDERVGWQLSGDVDTRPRFDPVERYRKRFFQPDKVAALFDDLRTNPERVSLTDVEPPQVSMLAEANRVTVEDLRLTLEAQASGVRDEQRLHHMNLWVNGAVVREWDNDDTKFLTVYDLPAALLRRGVNVVTFQAYNQADVRRQVSVEVTCEREAVPATLHALIIGVGDYREKTTGLGNLSAAKDALAVQQALQQQTKLFSQVEVVALRDRDASRDRILGELARLESRVRPDDTFVLFLGGHGASGKVIKTAAGDRAVRLTEKIASNLFVFCTHDFELEKPAATGLTSELLYAAVRRLNCRKVLLLDACHSGTIVEDPVRQLTPEGVGPVILSACEGREPAAEDEILGLQYTGGRANGVFTIALILALERDFVKADSNKDGILNAGELDAYVKRKVTSLLRDRLAEGRGQHPTTALPSRELELPLATRSTVPASNGSKR